MTISPEQFITALYRGLLHRPPDAQGLAIGVEKLKGGMPLAEVVEFFDQYRNRMVAATPETGSAPGLDPDSHDPTLLERLSEPAASIPKAEHPSILFLQTADPYHYHDMLAESSRTVRAYCQKHGFGYESYIGIKRGFFSWHAAYNRILILKELVESGFSGWVFYLDADAIITDQEFDLTSYLRDKSAYAAIFVDPGEKDVWYHVNNGIFLINAGVKEARDLIQKWFEEFMKISDQELKLATDWDDLPHDQDLLHVVLYQNQEFRSSIFLETPQFLGWGPGFVRQFTRRTDEALAERKRAIKSHVDELLGFAETAGTLHELRERDARVIVSVLYKVLLGAKPKWAASDHYSSVLRQDGLQYGLQRVVESIIQSEEFKSRFTPGNEIDLNYQQARMVGAALYQSLFEREPDWHALNAIPATLREQGLEIGLQTVIADIIGCDEFRIRHEIRQRAVAAPEP